MSHWETVEEDGAIFHVNERYGNILQVDDQTFICFLAKVVKLGPYTSLDAAKNLLETRSHEVSDIIDQAISNVK